MKEGEDFRIKIKDVLGAAHSLHQGSAERLSLPKKVVEKYRLKDEEKDFVFFSIEDNLMLIVPLKDILKNKTLGEKLRGALGFIDISTLSEKEILEILGEM